MKASPAAASVGTRPVATRLTTWPKAAMLVAESWQACQWVKRLPEGPAPLLRGARRSAVGQVSGGRLLVAGGVGREESPFGSKSHQKALQLVPDLW